MNEQHLEGNDTFSNTFLTIKDAKKFFEQKVAEGNIEDGHPYLLVEKKMSDFDTILRIAYETREWGEKYVRESGDPCFDEDDLSGFCAVAAIELHKRLETVGIESFLVMSYISEGGFSHCFNYVKIDGQKLLVDITATQFWLVFQDESFQTEDIEELSVIIIPVINAKERFWRPSYVSDSSESFAKRLIEIGWQKEEMFVQ